MTANACPGGRPGTCLNSRSFSRTTRLLHAARNAASPLRAASWRWPSVRKGIVASPTTVPPERRAHSTTRGATPVPTPPPSPAMTNVRSPPVTAPRTSFSCTAAKRAQISGRPPVPRTAPSPSSTFVSQVVCAKCSRSVFTATVRIPRASEAANRWTTFVPAPPHPTTRMRGPWGSTSVVPIPSAPGLPIRALRRLHYAASDVLAHRVANRVLDGDGVARLYQLLEVDDVPLRQLDGELADVIRGELLVDEPVYFR